MTRNLIILGARGKFHDLIGEIIKIFKDESLMVSFYETNQVQRFDSDCMVIDEDVDGEFILQ